MPDSRNDAAALDLALSELLGESVSVEGVETRNLDDVTISIVLMSYTRAGGVGGDSNQRSHVRQTAIVLQDNQLDLPHFTLKPTQTGVFGRLAKSFSTMGDINFDDTPVFSEAYFLHGWIEDTVRALFTTKIRDHFAERPGWSVIGKGPNLVTLQHNRICPQSEKDTFVEESVRILDLFQQSEDALDARPSLRRETRASDLLATANRMDGIVGAMYRKQLDKFLLTEEQLQRFLSDALPRRVPQPMKRQVIGTHLPFVIFGLVCIVASIAAGILTFALAKSDEWMLVTFILAPFPLIGAALVFFPMRHRLRKMRTLKRGEQFEAKVISVEATSTSINNQTRHHVSVAYRTAGEPRTAVCNAYSMSVDRANEFLRNGTPVRILVDPADPAHVIGVDFLVLADQ